MHTLDSDYAVLYTIFGEDLEVGRAICSPFGGDDNPSFSFYESSSDNPRIRYTLFNKAENGSIIDFIAKYEPLKCGGIIGLALKKYEEILKSEEVDCKAVSAFKTQSQKKPPRKLTLRGFFYPWEIKYWQDYKITETQLIYNEIYPVDSLYYSNYCTDSSAEGFPVYCYLYNKGESDKIYNPNSIDKKYKWKSNNISNLVCGYEQLPATSTEGVAVISSKKDGMCYRNHRVERYKIPYKDVAVCSPMAEGIFRAILNKEEEFIDRFGHIDIIRDTDPHGMLLAYKLYDAFKYKEKVNLLDIDYGLDHLNVGKYPYCKDWGEATLNQNNIIIKY